MAHARRYLVGVLAVTGAYDVWLASTGKRTITGALRDNRLVAGGFTVLLAAHVAGVLGPLDPFDGVGRLLARLTGD